MADTQHAQGDAEPAKNRKPVLIGCLTVAALVIGLPVACTAVLSAQDPRDTHDVSTDTAEAGDFQWPLTVDEGVIWCAGAGQLVFETGGTQYALNGLAKGAGYREIEPIWKNDPDIDGLKVPIDGLISHGNAVCSY